jgi:RHS Repeat
MNTEINRAAAPSIPPDATHYAYPAVVRWEPLIGFLITAGFATLWFYQSYYTSDPTTRIFQIPAAVYFALVAERLFRIFLKARYRIAVNAQGIWLIEPHASIYLAWPDVDSVRANDRQQCLELSNFSGSTAIAIEYQIGNFETLRDYILGHTSTTTQLPAHTTGSFHRGWDNKLMFGCFAAFLLIVALQIYHPYSHSLAPILPIACAAILIVFILFDPLRLDIAHDSFVIRYLLHRRTILFSTVTGVTLNDIRDKGNVWAAVVVACAQGRPIRLFRFREGSIALYESLLAAWRSSGSAFAAETAQPQPFSGYSQHAASQPASPALAVAMVLGAGVAISASAALLGVINHRGSHVGPTHASVAPLIHYPKHEGAVAPVSALKGSGTVYLVQMGDHKQPYSLADFAQWLRSKYSVDVEVLPAMVIDPSAWDARRHQYVAEQLYAQMKQKHSDLAVDHNAFLIGFTEGNMYSARQLSGFTFTKNDLERTAVVSSYRMAGPSVDWTNPHPADVTARLQSRVRRALLKNVATLYWHLPENSDPSSLLHDPFEPDRPADDIYASDIDPALSASGQQVREPCIDFAYSAKYGIHPMPGPLVRECGSVQNPLEDESVETFELRLSTGLLIDRHTEMYLPDTIPIAFQRVLRDGERGFNPFGISGADNYDEFLGSADNVFVFLERADGSRDHLVRFPRWLPVLPLVRYDGGERIQTLAQGPHGPMVRTAWQYTMAWHSLPFEYYEMRSIDGSARYFLPCDKPNLPCVLFGYSDTQGRRLQFERNGHRNLSRLTSPNGNWVGVGTAGDGRIIAIDDCNKRTILYGYDVGRRLVSVTYPSGAIYHYDYDDTQHMLSLTVAADAHSDPQTILSNEYQNGMLTKQTLSDGSAYTYAYDSSDPESIHHAIVHAPDQTDFEIDIGDNFSTIHEKPALSPQDK